MTWPFTRHAKAPEVAYSFCERVTAGPGSPLHIRQLTAAGLKTGGGADSVAFCGANVAWDTSTLNPADLDGMREREHPAFRICVKCAETMPRMPSA